MALERKKILVCAYACSPLRGSEPGMGWGFVHALANKYDVWVIVEEEKWKNDIEDELQANPELRDHLHFYFIRKQRNRLLRKIWPPSYYWYYKRWHKAAYRLAQELHQEHQFELVHQLNMVGYREPGYLWKLDVPFVWGPVGGLDFVPWSFMGTLGVYGLIFYSMRNLMNSWQIRFLRRAKLASERAARCGMLVSATTNTKKNIQKYWRHDSDVMCEIGINASSGLSIAKREKYAPLKIAWSGLHIPRKALHLLLKALAQVDPNISWELEILGHGYQTKKWQRMANRLGINDRCNWHGWIPKEKAVQVVSEAHVSVVSSLQDLTSTVIVEAISNGLPVICLNHHGFPDVVTEECGILIDVNNPQQVSQDMAQAITKLANDEPLRQDMAKQALKRSELFLWKNKIKQLEAVYAKVIGK